MLLHSRTDVEQGGPIGPAMHRRPAGSGQTNHRAAGAFGPMGNAALTSDVLIATAEALAERAELMEHLGWSWGEGILLAGMVHFARASGRPTPGFVTHFIETVRAAGCCNRDLGVLPPAGVAVSLGYDDMGHEALRWFRGTVDRLTWASNGALERVPGHVWADTPFTVGAFLMAQASVSAREDLMVEAGTQWLAHAELLQHRRCGLIAHARVKGEAIWCYWGRGNAAMALAGVIFLEQAAKLNGPRAHRLAGRVRTHLADLLDGLAEAQPDSGVWPVLIDDPSPTRGYVETSATAGIAAAMLRACQPVTGMGDRWRDAGWRAMRGLHPYVDPDGTLTSVSADTVPQLLPQGYLAIRNDRIQPWGQGFGLTAYAAALRDLTCGQSNWS